MVSDFIRDTARYETGGAGFAGLFRNLFDGEGGEPDAAAAERLAQAEDALERLADGGALTPAEIELLREFMLPEEFALYVEPHINNQGGVDSDDSVPFEEPAADFDPNEFGDAGPFDAIAALDAALRRLTETNPERGLEAEWGRAIAELARVKGQLLEEVDETRIRLDDGTVITQEEFDDLDPLSRGQVETFLTDRKRRIEQEARDVLNTFALDEYALERGAVNDENTRLVADYNARASEFRNQISRDELSLDQAVLALDREFKGLSESRARVKLEITTALEAAPFGTVGGKTAFTGGDLGAGVIRLMQQAGIQDAANVEAIRFPGSIQLNPAAALNRRDAELGVGQGPLPSVPGLTTAATAPGAPSLQPSIQLPTQLPPVAAGTIQLSPGAQTGQPPAPAEQRVNRKSRQIE